MADRYDIASILAKSNAARARLQHQQINDVSGSDSEHVRKYASENGKPRTPNHTLRKTAGAKPTYNIVSLSSEEEYSDDIDARPMEVDDSAGEPIDAAELAALNDFIDDRSSAELSSGNEGAEDDEGEGEQMFSDKEEGEDGDESSEDELQPEQMVDLVDDVDDELEHALNHSDTGEADGYHCISDEDEAIEAEPNARQERFEAKLSARELEEADRQRAEDAKVAKVKRAERMRRRTHEKRAESGKVVALSVSEMLSTMVALLAKHGSAKALEAELECKALTFSLSALVRDKNVAAYNVYLGAREAAFAELLDASHPRFAAALRQADSFVFAAVPAAGECMLTGKPYTKATGKMLKLGAHTFGLAYEGFAAAYQLVVFRFLPLFLENALKESSGDTAHAVHEFAAVVCGLLRDTTANKLDTENLIVKSLASA